MQQKIPAIGRLIILNHHQPWTSGMFIENICLIVRSCFSIVWPKTKLLRSLIGQVGSFLEGLAHHTNVRNSMSRIKVASSEPVIPRPFQFASCHRKMTGQYHDHDLTSTRSSNRSDRAWFVVHIFALEVT